MYLILYHLFPYNHPPVKFHTLPSESSVFPSEPQSKAPQQDIPVFPSEPQPNTLQQVIQVLPNKPRSNIPWQDIPLVPLVNCIQNPKASDKQCSLVNLIQELSQ
ncbi:hypothetical protein P8452_09451 [Trifolium repens]|nr:hypothetical protein P8452_09451 [Trifolium repens]